MVRRYYDLYRQEQSPSYIASGYVFYTTHIQSGVVFQKWR